jgi:hypothetical protein
VLAHGFARVRCESCKDELLVAFSCKGRGVCPSYGVFVPGAGGVRFEALPPPTQGEVEQLLSMAFSATASRRYWLRR